MHRLSLAILLVALLAACGGSTDGPGDGSGGASADASGGAEGGDADGGTSSTGGVGLTLDPERWAEWQEASAPRTEPHEVWTREVCSPPAGGSSSERIEAEYRVLPTPQCRVSGDLGVDERACEIQPYCETSADCTDGPRGLCEGVREAYTSCYYPQPPPEACSTDADCTAAPDGRCPTGLEIQNVWHCYPWGECLRPAAYCVYDSLSQVGCQTDADCTAVPDGECVQPLRFTACRYEACFEDEDCASGDRCGCGACSSAACAADDDCPEDETCELSSPQCEGLTGFYCTTPEDGCTAGEGGCIYDPGDGEEGKGHFDHDIIVCE